MDYNLLDALDLLEREKGVPAETILDALANALAPTVKPVQSFTTSTSILRSPKI